MRKFQLTVFLLVMAFKYLHAGDTVKIMPVGNSITAGEHYGFPVLEKRTGYRKPLYDMLVQNGYIVDFVGSQNHGIRYREDPNWFDWNCEAYPGWKIPDISLKLKEALVVYRPDILLVHVGTNGKDWDNKPAQVEEMLNMINRFSVENKHSITVFICLIINRFIDEDQAPTTQFNKQLTQMVGSRTGDSIRIILVDMENGAGLDYSDNPPNPNSNPPYEGGDMLGRKYPGVACDKYHPNEKGNNKMARKFYSELIKVLVKPIVTER
jgi:lysophospholipase L1-like esterase